MPKDIREMLKMLWKHMEQIKYFINYTWEICLSRSSITKGVNIGEMLVFINYKWILGFCPPWQKSYWAFVWMCKKISIGLLSVSQREVVLHWKWSKISTKFVFLLRVHTIYTSDIIFVNCDHLEFLVKLNITFLFKV